MANSKESIIAEVEESAKIMDDLYQRGDMKFFDFLTEDVVIFSNQATEPIRGRENYIKLFGPSLANVKRQINVLDRKIDVLSDDTAIRTQTLQVTQEEIFINLKQSIVQTKTGNVWKINHLHSSIIGTPQAVNQPKSLTGVRVLNEKIASMAAVVGVAQ